MQYELLLLLLVGSSCYKVEGFIGIEITIVIVTYKIYKSIKCKWVSLFHFDGSKQEFRGKREYTKNIYQKVVYEIKCQSLKSNNGLKKKKMTIKDTICCCFCCWSSTQHKSSSFIRAIQLKAKS